MRDFLVRVGFITTAIMVSVLLLNLILPSPPEIECVNGKGWIGLATKFPDHMLIKHRMPDGEITTGARAGKVATFTCLAVFGKDWINAKRQ